jgi:opacity protein-like surface antigen
MTKKMMLLALAAVSAAMFALPAVASAAPTIDPAGTSFTGTFGTSTLGAEGEPTITCLGENHVTGKFNTGSGTAGTISLDYTNCHIIVLGFTIACKTAGAPLSNTIALNSVPFSTTYPTAGKPGITIGPVNVTVSCGSTTPLVITGSVTGTITAPECGKSSETAKLVFKATNNIQEHGASQLSAETEESGVKKKAGLNTEATIKFPQVSTLTCI